MPTGIFKTVQIFILNVFIGILNLITKFKQIIWSKVKYTTTHLGGKCLEKIVRSLFQITDLDRCNSFMDALLRFTQCVGIISTHFCPALTKARRISLACRSEYSVVKIFGSHCARSGNGTPQISLLFVKGNFKILSQINTAPVLSVPSTDCKMEPSFTSEEC
jgi:hypothetical protein